jgi:ABC-type phosphate transport system substrate-binding protein
MSGLSRQRVNVAWSDLAEVVVQFVAATPGAIGYVNETAVTSSLRVIFYLQQTMSGGEKKAMS